MLEKKAVALECGLAVSRESLDKKCMMSSWYDVCLCILTGGKGSGL